MVIRISFEEATGSIPPVPSTILPDPIQTLQPKQQQRTQSGNRRISFEEATRPRGLIPTTPQVQPIPVQQPLVQQVPSPEVERPLLGAVGMLPEVTGVLTGAKPGQKELAGASTEELGIGQLGAAKIAGGFLLEPSVQGRADIIKEVIPSARFDVDESGNPFTIINDKKFFLNKAGLSPQDLLDLGNEITKFLPGAKIAGAATKGASLFTRAGAQAIAAGSTGVGTQAASEFFGNTQPIDLGRALIAAGFAGGSEIVAPIIGLGIQKILKNELLTQVEKTALKDAGVNPDTLTREEIIGVTQGRPFGDAVQRLRLFEGESLPTPIPQTTGDLSQSTNQRLLEQRGVSAEFGANAQQVIQDVALRQNQAIQDNIAKISSDLGLGKGFTPTEAGDIVQRKLVALKRTRKREVTDAYESALDNNVFVPITAKETIKTRLIESLEKAGIDQVDFTGFNDILKKVDAISAPVPEGIPGLTRRRASEFKLNKIESLRQSVNSKIIGTAGTNATQRRAGNILAKELNDVLNDFIDGGLLSGDAQVLNQIKQARNKFRLFKKTFEDGKDAVKTLTERVDAFGQDRRLVVSPDDAINVVFGRNSIAKKSGGDSIVKLKRVLNKEDFALLKEAGFTRLLGKGNVEGNFSASVFERNLSKAIKENPRLMRNLFNKKEMQTIQRFARIAARIERKDIIKPAALRNLIGTAGTTLRRIFGNTGFLAEEILNKLAIGVPSGVQSIRARGVEGALLGAEQVPPLVPAGAAAIGQQIVGELTNEDRQ